jgi:hypothetical protein
MKIDSHEVVYNVDENGRFLWIEFIDEGKNKSAYTNDMGRFTIDTQWKRVYKVSLQWTCFKKRSMVKENIF